MIVYLLETEYKDDKRNRTIISLSHVTNLMEYQSKLVESGLWDKVMSIQTDKKSMEYIRERVDAINFEAGDTLHIFGKEFVSFYMLHKADKGTNCILTDEGIFSNVNMNHIIDVCYHKEWFDGKAFDFSSIDELWLMDSRVSEDAAGIKVKNLNMQSVFGEKEFRYKFAETLKKIFPIDNSYVPQLCFFDAYHLQMYGCMSVELEQFLLETTAHTLSPYSLVIKPHPGERNYNKYENIRSQLSKESHIPWEVFRLFEDEYKNEGKILIAYSATGAIFHEKLLFTNEKTHFIFLEKIYNKFSSAPVNPFDSLTLFSQVYGRKNVYFPETFTELRTLTESLLKKKSVTEPLAALEKERQFINHFFTSFYKNYWKFVPTPYNITSLMYLQGGNVYNSLSEQRIKLKGNQKSDFKIQFDLEKNTYHNLRWYIVRNRKILLIIKKIELKTDGEKQTLDLGRIEYLGASLTDNGFWDFVTLDPCVQLHFPNPVDQIVISGEWIMDDAYNSITRTYHESIENRDNQNQNLNQILQQKISDLESYDRNVKALHVDIDERDRHIRILINRLEIKDGIIAGLRDEIREFEKKDKRRGIFKRNR